MATTNPTEPHVDKPKGCPYEGHAPEPWVPVEDIAGDTFSIYDRHGDFVVCSGGMESMGIDNEANAKLIAAAPTLLKENQQLREQLEVITDDLTAAYMAGVMKSDETINKLREQLAEAHGVLKAVRPYVTSHFKREAIDSVLATGTTDSSQEDG